MSEPYKMLEDGDVITDETEFEVAPGVWEKCGNCKSISARWMIGAPYRRHFFVPARVWVADASSPFPPV